MQSRICEKFAVKMEANTDHGKHHLFLEWEEDWEEETFMLLRCLLEQFSQVIIVSCSALGSVSRTVQ